MMSLLIAVTGETHVACRREVLGRYGRRIVEEGSASLSSADARDLAIKLSELNAALLRQGEA
jgi:hypothetical protein